MAVFKSALDLAKSTWNGFSDDEATWKAAALAYYTVFALAPLLVILLQIASLVWDPGEIRQALTGQFQSLMGKDVADQVGTMMMSAERKAESGTGLRLLLSIGGLLFGATGAFVSLQTALNRAWEVEPDPKRGGVKNFVTKRILSLGMVLAIAFLVLVSLALTAALSVAGGVLFSGLGETVAVAFNFVLTFAVIAALFAAMFKVLPDAVVAWQDVWVGAIGTAALFVIGKFLIGLYIGQSDPGSAFGAAGSLAVLLVWIYYAALIVLLGAEFTQAWAKLKGREIVPEEGAVRVVERKQRVRETGEIETEDKKHEDSTRRSTADARVDDMRGRRPGLAADDGVRTAAAMPARTPDAVRREMAATRERLSDTIGEIDSRLSDATSRVKAKLSPTNFVQRHPWPVLAAAVVAGITLSAAHGDEEVADDSTTGRTDDERADGAVGQAAMTESARVRVADVRP